MATTNSPVIQPTAAPGSTGIAYTEFLYVSLALIMLIILICLIMCGMKRMCNRKRLCDKLWQRNASYEDNQDVEVIVETEATIDSTNYAEAVEAARERTGSQSFRDTRGSLKRYGSWFGYGSARRGLSLAVAEEYQGNTNIETGLAAPMRVMETFQDMNDYNVNSAARNNRQAIISTVRRGSTPATTNTVATLDARDMVTTEQRPYSRHDHDYLIETERNMGEVNDQFVRFVSANIRRNSQVNAAAGVAAEGGVNGVGVNGGVVGAGVTHEGITPAAVLAEENNNNESNNNSNNGNNNNGTNGTNNGNNNVGGTSNEGSMHNGRSSSSIADEIPEQQGGDADSPHTTSMVRAPNSTSVVI